MNWVNEDDECKTALHQSILGVGFFFWKLSFEMEGKKCSF